MRAARLLLSEAARTGPTSSSRVALTRCNYVNASSRANGIATYSSRVAASPIPSTPNATRRAFTSCTCLQKKGGKQAREEKRVVSQDAPADDPFDFSVLEADISAVIERLKNDLSKLRAGGRFNPEVLEVLRVQPDKASNQTVKLSDVAQVIPKGRIVHIMVGEQDHIKPVTSTIQSSNLSLTPQPDPTGQNPLLLVINIPPPTADSRRAAVAEALKAGEKAGMAMRDARGKQQKIQRAMQLSKTARPDDLRKAGKEMEKVAEKGAGEVKKIVDGAKKALESG